MTEAARSPFQPVDDVVRQAARALRGEARHAALACIDPDTGAPADSRVLVATDTRGIPFCSSRNWRAILRHYCATGRHR
ncbi:hypothetical protein [Aureimonas pseudogalii]|uniref:Uncharacterized protein n=1 Tax=Aureimonas pseudogalii TaxID=1744844 RepID=A0A7W6EB76_9HYPH|nr:hypothetical protein [Aureimonas pseudogalii]MBB3998138.1 hypothetical protein [Aureimonas pseudogalii]